MKILYLVIVLLVAILAVLFAAQNSATVAITFFNWSTSGSLSLVLIITLSLGILIGVLVMAPSVFKRAFQSSGLKRRVRRLEKERTAAVAKPAPAIQPADHTAAPTGKPAGNTSADASDFGNSGGSGNSA